MKAVKRIAAAALSSALVMSFASVQAFAATAENEINGVTITYTTDKDEYAADDVIDVTVTLKADSDKNLDLIDFSTYAPENYTIDSEDRSFNEVSEGEDGEGPYVVYEIKNRFVRVYPDEESSEVSEESETSEISEVSEVSETSEVSEASEESETSEDSETSEVSETSTASEASEGSETSTASEASEDSKTSETTDDTSSVNTVSQVSAASQTSITNTNAAKSTVVTSTATTTAAGTVKTGDSTNVLLIAVIITAAAALSVFCIKNKKARKFLSLMLCTAVISGAAVAASVNTSAAPEEDPDTTVESGRETDFFPYLNSVSTTVLIDGEETELVAQAEYTVTTEAVRFSGTVKNSDGEPVSNAIVIVGVDALYLNTNTDAEGNYSFTVPYERAEPYTLEFTAEGYKQVNKSVIDVEENRTIDVVLLNEEEEQEGRHSVGFYFDPMESKCGEEPVSEYGFMIYTNEDAVITKAAGSLYMDGDNCNITVAFVGENVTEAEVAVYYAADEKVIYSGLDEETILHTYTMRESDGVWSVFGEYAGLYAKAADSEGNTLKFDAKDIIGTNMRVFDHLSDAKAWLRSED